MSPLRRKRKTFFGPVGTAYSLFSKRNIPTQGTYENVLDSVLFSAESDDTAKTSEAGHVKLATDAHAQVKNDNTGDGHQRVVVPHQLPGIATASENEPVIGGTDEYSEEGIKVTAVSKSLGGGLTRLLYKIQALYQDSIVLDALTGAFKLSGDDCNPADGTVYGKRAGVKGWYPEAAGVVTKRLIYQRILTTPGVLKAGDSNPQYIEAGTPGVAISYEVDMTKYLTVNGDTLTIVSEFSRGGSSTNREHWVKVTGSAASFDCLHQETASDDEPDAYFIHTTTITRLDANRLYVQTHIENITDAPTTTVAEPSAEEALTWTTTLTLNWMGQDDSTTSINLHRIRIYHDAVL